MTYVSENERAGLAHHYLEVHVDTPNLKAWYLRRPSSGRMWSTLILSTAEGLVIMGDLCPGRNGVISCYGYDHRWFGAKLSEQYLCSKFLQREWVPEKGSREIRELILTERRHGNLPKDDARNAWEDLRSAEEYGNLSGERAYQIVSEAGFDFDGIGYDYNPSAAAWLCAIQQRFHELYAASLKVAA